MMKLDLTREQCNELVMRIVRTKATTRVVSYDVEKVTPEMFKQAAREVLEESWWNFDSRTIVSTAVERKEEMWVHAKVEGMDKMQSIFDPQNRPVYCRLEEGVMYTSEKIVHVVYRKVMEPCQWPLQIIECVVGKLALLLAAKYAPQRVNDLKAWYYQIQKWAVQIDKKVDAEAVEQPGVNDIGFLIGYQGLYGNGRAAGRGTTYLAE